MKIDQSYCQYCGQKIEHPAELTGQTTQCPSCKKVLFLEGDKLKSTQKPYNNFAALIIIILLASVNALLVASLLQAKQSNQVAISNFPPSPRYDYKIVEGKGYSITFLHLGDGGAFLINDLQQLGSEGWELISWEKRADATSLIGQQQFALVFKKRTN